MNSKTLGNQHMKRHTKTAHHPELSLGSNHEIGTAETFVWHLLSNNVDLSQAKENIKKHLQPKTI